MPTDGGGAAALVARLQALAPRDTGSHAWWSQCASLERLNAAVHAAGSGADGAATAAEVVGAFAAAPQAVQLLVHTLLVAEAWRERVLPHVGAQTSPGRQSSCHSVSLPVRGCSHASLLQSPPDRRPGCATTWRATTRRWWPTCWRRCWPRTPCSRRRRRTRCLSWPTTALGRHVADTGPVRATRSGPLTRPSAPAMHCTAGVPDHREAQRPAGGSVRVTRLSESTHSTG